MEYKLVDYANIIKLGEYNIYIITDDIIELEVDDPIVYDILIELKKGCTENKLLKYISKNELVEFLNILIENNLLMNNYKNMYIDKLEEKQVYYFDKFNDDSNKIQEKLCGSKVAILGVGGVGSVVIQHLVASGVKEFILIDNDIVQRNNFNRQLIYNTLDIGQLKVECAKKYILSIDSSIKVTTINIMITDTTKLSFLKELNQIY